MQWIWHPRNLLLAAAAALALATPSHAEALSYHCKVNDPTGTPLNIRDQGMRIIGTIDNGVLIYMVQVAKDANGKDWAQVTDTNGSTLGWVYREFLSCY